MQILEPSLVATEALRVLAAVALMFLPGAWISYGWRSLDASFSLRLAVAAVLSPVVVIAQYLLFRSAGVSVGAAAWFLVLANAPAAWFLIRRRPKIQVSFRDAAASTLVFVLLFMCAAFSWMVPGDRYDRYLFTGHVLMHTGIINQLALGAWPPEEPEMAGLRLAYPTLGHVNWLVLSRVLDWAPARTYAVTHLVWLAACCVVVMGICREAGCSAMGSRIAAVWLGLGVNSAAWILSRARMLLGHPESLHGDIRFTPWVRKFAIFEVSAYGAVLFAVLVLAGLAGLRTGKRGWLGLGLLSFAGLGFIYPNLLPVALIFVAIVYLESCVRASGSWHKPDWRMTFEYGAWIVVGCALVAAYVMCLTRDRVMPAH